MIDREFHQRSVNEGRRPMTAHLPPLIGVNCQTQARQKHTWDLGTLSGLRTLARLPMIGAARRRHKLPN